MRKLSNVCTANIDITTLRSYSCAVIVIFPVSLFENYYLFRIKMYYFLLMLLLEFFLKVNRVKKHPSSLSRSINPLAHKYIYFLCAMCEHRISSIVTKFKFVCI